MYKDYNILGVPQKHVCLSTVCFCDLFPLYILL